MSLQQFYSERIQNIQNKLLINQQKETRLSLLRLGSFILAWIIFYISFNIHIGFATFLLILGLGLFGYILKLHLRTSLKKQHLKYLLEINEKELACIKGDFQSFPDGKEYTDKDHPYTGDLDIFGKSSLFQYTNRTTSHPGSNRLAQWLIRPAETDEIIKRQEAITELKDLVEWRQEFIAIGYRYADSANNPEPILEWLNEKPLFLKRKFLKYAINVLSVLTILVLVGYFFGIPSVFIPLILSINFFILYQSISSVNKIHKNVSKTVDLLKSYESILSLIENQEFRSKKLILLQEVFKQKSYKASRKIKQLSQLVNKLDFRLNIMVSLPLNLFFFWDIRQIINLEKWKIRNSDNLPGWFDAMAEFEALISLSNLYFNNPDWTMPEIHPEHFLFAAEDIGHPLIINNRRVTNSIEISDREKVIIITGSNMSGKSTFLRTCGINIILAMTGAPVCAKHIKISNVTVYTSMRIIDSLEENTSSFYAELKRLATIIQTVERNENVFLLLDEILRGTNSNDRHIGSVALIRQLIKNKATAIIATHDLSLSSLRDEMPEKIDNYNFDVKIMNDELFFDYKLNKGICTSLNASILMKKMGIKV